MNETYETVTDANEFNMIEAAAKAAIGIGCTNVVNNVVKVTTPFHVGFWTKQLTKLGATCIGFAVGDYISDYTVLRIREIMKDLNQLKENGGFI